jgi:hypothetical protein
MTKKLIKKAVGSVQLSVASRPSEGSGKLSGASRKSGFRSPKGGQSLVVSPESEGK